MPNNDKKPFCYIHLFRKVNIYISDLNKNYEFSFYLAIHDSASDVNAHPLRHIAIGLLTQPEPKSQQFTSKQLTNHSKAHIPFALSQCGPANAIKA